MLGMLLRVTVWILTPEREPIIVFVIDRVGLQRPQAVAGSQRDCIGQRATRAAIRREAMMARKPGGSSANAAKAALEIAARAPNLQWGGWHCLATDLIGMEFVLEGDPALRNQLAGLRLEAAAQVHRTMADASTKAAQIIKSRG